MRRSFLLLALLVAGCATAPPTPSTAPVPPTALPVATPEAIPPTPSASTTGYALDCGPLDPERCRTDAAALDRYHRDRGKRLVSIVYTTPCASYSALFDDGTGIGADIDCILPSPSVP